MHSHIHKRSRAIITCLLAHSCFAQSAGPGSAQSFDGTGGYVSIATTGSLTGTFTVELWAQPNDTSPSGTLGLLGSRRPWDFSFDIIFFQGSLVHSDLGNNYTWISTAANALLQYSTNSWHHVAEVVTPTNYTIYVDGSALATGSYAPDGPLLYDDNHMLVIGNFSEDLAGYNGDEYMIGRIDEVRIWNTARTATQIQTNAFRSLTGAEDGLVGYWRFDEGSGDTIDDASGHRFIGTIVPSSFSGPTWVDSAFPDGKLLILSQPQGQVVEAGASPTLGVGVFGAEPLSYQWQFNLTNLPLATNATLMLSNVRPTDSGQYSVMVSNNTTNTLSSAALVTVVAPALQISPSGDNVLLWWPTNASGFGLETCPTPGGQGWTRFSAPVRVIDDQNVVVADALNASQFFRLHKP
jgi:hypothetical protein